MSRLKRLAMGMAEAAAVGAAMIVALSSMFVCAFGFCNALTMFLMMGLSFLVMYWISERVENRKYRRKIRRICKEL